MLMIDELIGATQTTPMKMKRYEKQTLTRKYQMVRVLDDKSAK